MRYFAKLSYLGKNYHGWQIQPDVMSVQQKIETTLETIFSTPTPIVAAGRTDTGVHASEMFIHFDTIHVIDKDLTVYKMNSILPEDIVIDTIFDVKQDAHARFDAINRSYEYKIFLGRHPFSLDTHWQIHHQKLDINAMNTAAQYLLDYIDFQCFSKVKTDVKTYNCVITKAKWLLNENELVFHISANRFLRNMVRAIVGTLCKIGQGKYPPEHIKTIIESKNRANAGPSAPAKGLFLTKITYPENIKHV